MAKLRYVRTPAQLKRAAQTNPEFLSSTVRSIRVVYETDAAVTATVTPKPLEPCEEPLVCVTFSHVAMEISPELTIEIGSAIFGVRASYDGVEGTYLITMPMTTEQAVVPGRETYGEPKKIAEIDFRREGNHVSSRVQRMGIPYLEVEGRLGATLPAREFTEYGYCFKAFPSCERSGELEGDPLLVRLAWEHVHHEVHSLDDAELVLRESPFDPVADLPVRRMRRMEYEVGRTRSNGRVLRSVPAAWLLPFMHGRYDDVSADGIEIETGA
ncbi:MAG: acetoacetate decarboxylase family protein [Myxococcota bacterium]